MSGRWQISARWPVAAETAILARLRHCGFRERVVIHPPISQAVELKFWIVVSLCAFFSIHKPALSLHKAESGRFLEQFGARSEQFWAKFNDLRQI